MAFDDWLDEATPADLDALAQCLIDGRIPSTNSAGSIQLAGFDSGAIKFLAHFDGTKLEVIALILQRLARERRAADDRYANIAQLVWSGPSDDGEAIRDTRVVLDDLFRRARRYVLISTFVVYDGLSVFRRLVEQMQQVPGLQVDLFVNLPSKTGLTGDESGDVREFISTFTRYHWPAGIALPNIYYDPQTRNHGNERTSLHAKCVVVDERWAFVTSANFTEAAQERNIEAGILLDQPALAGALVRRFEALRDSGVVKKMV